MHLDETGWRESGRNGYVWMGSTPELRLFRHGTRQKAMVAALLGEAYPGVMVSDFYAAYTGDDRGHQYCWAHVLRDVRELAARHPAHQVVASWADRVGGVREPRGTSARWAVRRDLQAELWQLCLPWAEVALPQRTLCGRVLTHLPDLFTFVTEPDVPATNNAAEHRLRHQVVARTISGGTR